MSHALYFVFMSRKIVKLILKDELSKYIDLISVFKGSIRILFDNQANSLLNLDDHSLLKFSEI